MDKITIKVTEVGYIVQFEIGQAVVERAIFKDGRLALNHVAENFYFLREQDGNKMILLINEECDASIRIDRTEEGMIRFSIDVSHVTAKIEIEEERVIGAFQRFVASAPAPSMYNT